MKLYVDRKKKKYVEAILVCSKCKMSFPDDEIEEHVKNCRGEQPGYT